MWQAGTLFVIIVSLLVLLRQARCLGKDWLTVYVLLMIWLRFAVSSLSDVTLQTTVGGHSLVAISTLGSAGFGVLVTPLALFRAPWLMPVYGFVLLGLVSGVLGETSGDLPTFVTLWLFFVVCAVLLHRAYWWHGPRALLRCLLAVYSLPLGVQLLSVVLDNPKVATDGTLNYIGGYLHEAVYALVALGGLWLASLYPFARPRDRWIACAAFLAALALANYRTVLIAVLPVLLAYLLHLGRPGAVRIGGRLVLAAVALAFAVLVLGPSLVGDRFQEIGVVLANIGELAKRPEEYTALERNLLSARSYIWSVYAYAFIDSDLPQLLIGHGPEALAPGMDVHPHNEYIRILYQFGLVGAVYWYGLLARLTLQVARTSPRQVAVATSAGFVAVFLAALGTSVFNRPEGMVLLALLFATARYLMDLRASIPGAAAPARAWPRRKGGLQGSVRRVAAFPPPTDAGR